MFKDFEIFSEDIFLNAYLKNLLYSFEKQREACSKIFKLFRKKVFLIFARNFSCDLFGV